ncbi:MAG TPA: DUF1194 domain-containing protein [Propylenella sp.]|nr:DUF1194 domain-containing protein [Propylenella sp.]
MLAVDVSFSMDPEEQALQRQGYVDAFRSPEVVSAIRNGPLGRIAVTYVEWGGKPFQIMPWTLVDGSAASEAFAEELGSIPLRRISFTSITEALLFGARLFRANEFKGVRRVIDVSGDGPNNSGAPVPLARNALVADGIVIDGLPIMLEERAFPNLDAYYESCVIGGSGAFAIKVTSAADFSRAIRQKLVLEITGDKLTGIEGEVVPVRDENYNCLIGEELHESGGP